LDSLQLIRQPPHARDNRTKPVAHPVAVLVNDIISRQAEVFSVPKRLGFFSRLTRDRRSAARRGTQTMARRDQVRALRHGQGLVHGRGEEPQTVNHQRLEHECLPTEHSPRLRKPSRNALTKPQERHARRRRHLTAPPMGSIRWADPPALERMARQLSAVHQLP
jgi:hypothetical protein